MLDWFGDDEAHAEFRRKARGAALANIWQSFQNKVPDLTFPSPLPTPSFMTESLPTEARIAQKARLKQMAEKGREAKEAQTGS